MHISFFSRPHSINKLKNLELSAREKQLGMWNTNEFARTKFTGTILASTDKVRKGRVTGVDLNEASFEELQTLPGIGPKMAERIMANRPYLKVDDLLKVTGIGPMTIEQFRERVRVESPEEK